MSTALEQWNRAPNAVTAMEVADAIALLGPRPEAAAAEQYLSEQVSKPGRPKVRLNARAPLDLGREAQRTIQSLKRRLLLRPNDALGYVDLAREYVLLGQERKAKRSMHSALSIASNDRFVLRSATRLYSHIGDLEQAYDLLRKSDAVRVDPWVMAAEVAAADILGKSPRWGPRHLRELLGSHRIGTDQSELASALATMETRAGAHKRAKRLFERSLDAPTENALAQAAWVQGTSYNPGIDLRLTEANKQAFEAEVIESVLLGNYTRADWNAMYWLDDEPFSLRAATHGSYLNSTFRRDHDRALTFIDRGLVANPKDDGLLNNKAFSLLQLGAIEEAMPLVPNPNRSGEGTTRRPYDLAMNGLLAFKMDEPEIGRKYYQEAVEAARKVEAGLAFNAAIHWIEQEVFSVTLPIGIYKELVQLMDVQVSKAKLRIRSASQTWEAIRGPVLEEIARQEKLGRDEALGQQFPDDALAQMLDH